MKNKMKLTASAFFLLLASTSLSSCGEDKITPNPKASSQVAVNSLLLDNSKVTSDDIEAVESAKSGDSRRVKSLINAKKASIYSADQEGTSVLISAAKANNSSIVDDILEFTAKNDQKTLDRGDAAGKTALHYATENSNIEIIESLLEKGANPNIYDKSLTTPLHIAVEKGNVDVIKSIITSENIPTNPDIKNSVGQTPVYAALKNKNAEVLKLLTDYGANLNISDTQGLSPLSYTVTQNDKANFDFLLQNKADINYLSSNDKTALIVAIEQKNAEFIKHAVDNGADANKHTKDLLSPLQILFAQGDADVNLVQLLISKGAKLESAEMPLGSVITKSIAKGNAKAVEYLLKNGANIKSLETETSSGLIDSIKLKDAELAKVLIANGANYNQFDADGYSPLALAARENLTDVFDALIKVGADVNQTSRNNNSVPFEIVFSNDNGDLMTLMLTSGLKNTPDTILIRAISEGKNNIIIAALANGANANATNNFGQTALWLATAKDSLDAVKALVEAGADINVQDSEKGLSPLILATLKKSKEMIQFLIDSKANIDLQDKNGVSAVGYATLTGDIDTLTLLIQKGANLNLKDAQGNSLATIVENSSLNKNVKRKMLDILSSPSPQVN